MDFIIVAAATLVQTVLLALLIARRVFRSLPLFVAYNAYELIAYLVELAVVRDSPQTRLLPLIVELILETALFLLVLLELGKSVLKFNRITQGSRVLAILLLGAALIFIWPATQWNIPLDYPLIWRISLRLLQISTVLQSAAFGTLIAWSSINKLRWPNREFRIATGMGIWTVVSLGALMLLVDGHTRGLENHWVAWLTPTSCLFVAIWWLHYFWFESPQVEEMQDSPVFELTGAVWKMKAVNHINSASA